MSSRRLLSLVGAAALLLLAALWISMARTPTSNGAQPYFYPGLRNELNDITAVDVFGAGDKRSVEIKRGAADWTVTERSNYPADAGKVRRLLIGLGEARSVEEKTSNPASYSVLGLQDLTDKGAAGQRLQLVGGKVPVNVILGKQDSGTSATFVRRAGEPKSWSVTGSLKADTSPGSWLQRPVADIGADRIQNVAVAIAADHYTAAKKARADADFAVTGVPKGRELSSPSAANSLASALGNFELEDVRPAAELTDKSAAHATFKTFDGLVIDVDGWNTGDKQWVVLKPSFDEALARQFYVATQNAPTVDSKAAGSAGAAPAAGTSTDKAPSASASKPASTPPALTSSTTMAMANGAAAKPDNGLTAALEKGRTEAKALADKVNGWAYEVQIYKYQEIFKPVDELLKKEESKKKPEPKTGATAKTKPSQQ